MKPSLIILALTMIITSCGSQSDEPMPDSFADKNLVTVNFTASKQAQSRADKINFVSGDNITLYRQNATTANKWTLQYSNGKFDYTTSSKITKSPDETVRYIGLYPASSSNISVVNSHAFRFYGGTQDLLLAVEETASSNVSLTFIHILSKIEFQVKNAPSTISSVKLLNIEPRYYVDIEGDTSAEGTQTNVNMQWDSSLQRYCYYIAPMNFMNAQTAILRITYTNGNTLDLTPPSTGYFDNGKCYSWVYDYSSRAATVTSDKITFEKVENL